MTAGIPVPVPPGFVCKRCGNCCRPHGYVRLTVDDVQAIAAVLDVAVNDFVDRYTCLTEDRRGLSLIEKPDGACVFLTDDNTCRVQPAKPRQCRDFPHTWRYRGWETICKGYEA
jgi:Fe-S-cluster containining protein